MKNYARTSSATREPVRPASREPHRGPRATPGPEPRTGAEQTPTSQVDLGAVAFCGLSEWEAGKNGSPAGTLAGTPARTAHDSGQRRGRQRDVHLERTFEQLVLDERLRVVPVYGSGRTSGALRVQTACGETLAELPHCQGETGRVIRAAWEALWQGRPCWATVTGISSSYGCSGDGSREYRLFTVRVELACGRR